MKSKNVLGLNLKLIQNRASIDSLLKNKKGVNMISKVNSEFFVRALNDLDFRKTLEKSEYIIVDGVGVQWAFKYLSLSLLNLPLIRNVQAIWQVIWTGASLVFYPKYCASICERIPGQEAFNLMLQVAEKEKKNVYILGGEQEVLDKAILRIKEKFPKLKLVGAMEGWNFKDEDAIQDINNTKAELLIVALGSPRQEFWIRDNLDKLKTVKVAVGEGGTLDFVAGSFKRAPIWMNKLGIEWLWRLFMNKSKTQTGSRLKRVWNAVPVFIYQVYMYKVKNEAK